MEYDSLRENLSRYVLTLFGATGDLATRKLIPALYQAYRFSNQIQQGKIICLGRQNLSQEEYKNFIHQKAKQYLADDVYDIEVWQQFIEHIEYYSLEAHNLEDYKKLKTILEAINPEINIYYLSTSPHLFTIICEKIMQCGLNTKNARLVVEKPLGHDLQSAKAINTTLKQVFDEKQIFRIDHYLGKESVQNLMALRFANTLFEPLWRREWIHNIQITIAEDGGIENRGEFYDSIGAMRDMVQNHLLQLLCFIAMEPPLNLEPDSIRDEKLKVLKALVPFNTTDVAMKTVRGFYKEGIVNGQSVIAYHNENGVDPHSTTETYVALRADMANWRWAGVPFYLRTGKRLTERMAEIIVNFKNIPHQIFSGIDTNIHTNKLIIRLQPTESIKLYFLAKPPGETMQLKPAHLDLDFTKQFNTRRPSAYERLLLEVIKGDLSLFVRQDELEQAWNYVTPIIEAWQKGINMPQPYYAGTWGPNNAITLLKRDHMMWHEFSNI
jgi:glucose-6-phosphate 1-dehydrogenase